MWDLSVSVPDHCLSFYFSLDILYKSLVWRFYKPQREFNPVVGW